MCDVRRRRFFGKPNGANNTCSASLLFADDDRVEDNAQRDALLLLIAEQIINRQLSC